MRWRFKRTYERVSGGIRQRICFTDVKGNGGAAVGCGAKACLGPLLYQHTTFLQAPGPAFCCNIVWGCRGDKNE